MPLTARAAALYLTTVWSRFCSPTTALFRLGSLNFYTCARPDPHLAMTGPSDVRELCNARVWDKRRRSRIGSHAEPVLPTAAGDLLHFAPRSESSRDHHSSRPSASCRPPILCRLYTYLFLRHCFIEAMCFASIPSETDSSFQNCIARKRA